MATLFSYCIRHDAGAAPNPFWGVCTLVICKPRIRLAAEVGDWIVGTGSSRSPAGDMSGRVVCAMQVTGKMSMEEYWRFTRRSLRKKIPCWSDGDWRRRLGDSIYDFSSEPPTLRRGVHTEKSRARDLGGRYALLSKHFWYFGDKARALPAGLRGIVKQGPGHRSDSNAPYLDKFVRWLEGLGLRPNELYGRPQLRLCEEGNGPGCVRRSSCG